MYSTSFDRDYFKDISIKIKIYIKLKMAFKLYTCIFEYLSFRKGEMRLIVNHIYS